MIDISLKIGGLYHVLLPITIIDNILFKESMLHKTVKSHLVIIG